VRGTGAGAADGLREHSQCPGRARLGKAARIDKRVHAHGLRHTHAAELRAEGVDIVIISRQLGHRGLATTVRYLDHIAPTAVIEAIGKRAW
jgi:integrase